MTVQTAALTAAPIHDLFQGLDADDLEYIDLHGLSEFTWLTMGRARRRGFKLDAEATYRFLDTHIKHRALLSA